MTPLANKIREFMYIARGCDFGPVVSEEKMFTEWTTADR